MKFKLADEVNAQKKQERLHQIRYNRDMLDGNLNRMCVTDDMCELARMRDFAMKRVNDIAVLNRERLLAKKGESEC